MNIKNIITSILAVFSLAPSAFATFHLMQVEQVIGGLDGDVTAQAIQLRMRFADQEEVSATRLRVWNAAGTSPVVVLNITSDVSHSAGGSRILLATPSFTTAMKAISPSFAPDFTMFAPIPQTDLAAGRLTFETDTGVILWSFAWGGATYTGPNSGTTDNDADGNFGPAFVRGLPTASRQGVRFKGPASAFSTTNAADYALSANPTKVVRNDGTSYVIGSLPEIVVEQPVGKNLVDGAAKSFGSSKVGRIGKTRTFTIRNAGTATLTGLRIRKNGDNPGDFTVTQLSKKVLAPGASVKFKITFKPTSQGKRKAAIHIRSNDENENPFDIKLTGSGTAP